MHWPCSPLVQFTLFILAMAVLEPAYYLALRSRGEVPLRLMLEVLRDAKAIVLVAWMVADAKERRRTPCFDYGFFLFMLYPFSLFWYWTRLRGWSGLGFSVGLVLLTALPPIVTGFVALLAQ
jgi:hypothetical protein